MAPYGLPGPARTSHPPARRPVDPGRVDTVATANLYGPARFFLGYVWLRHAPQCGAMWARFERPQVWRSSTESWS